MYYDFIQRNKKTIVLYTGTFVVFLIIFSLWTFIDRAGKTPLVISVVPRDAHVIVADQKKGHGTHYLRDGQYEIEVKKEGFETQKRTITITNAKDQNVVAVSLGPVSDSAKDWASKNEDLYKQNEEFGAIEAASNGAFFAKTNPITKQLPFIDPYFTITYVSSSDNSITLSIETPSPRYRYYAIAKLRTLGYDPTDYKIVFKDFRNPLEQP